MATNTLKTRIQLKYDLYENWYNNNPTPKQGELCIVVVPAETNAVVQEPAVLLKVGDGEKAFRDLGWIGGTAADVYDWAKAEKKPNYKADEIAEIDAYISKYVNETMGISVDTDTQYTIVPVEGNAYQYKLMSKVKGGSAFDTEVATITIPKYDDTSLSTRITNNANAIATLNGGVSDAGSVAKAIADAIAGLDLANTYEAKGKAAEEAGKVQDALDEYIEANDGVISAIKNGSAIDSFKDVEDALAEKQEAIDDIIADIGTVPADKTIVQMIEDAQEAATYDDTELAGKVNTLIGEDAGKSARTIANEELAKQLIPENAAESLNDLQEIAAWIQSHPNDASAMNEAITALQNKLVLGTYVDGEETKEYATVKAYVEAAIAALKIGDYATAANLTELAGRVTALENKSHEHANKTELDKFADGDKAKLDKAATDAVHENRTVLDGITAEKVTAWDKVSEKANDADLKAIAKSGNVNDLIQTEGDYIIFNCGSSSEVI